MVFSDTRGPRLDSHNEHLGISCKRNVKRKQQMSHLKMCHSHQRKKRFITCEMSFNIPLWRQYSPPHFGPVCVWRVTILPFRCNNYILAETLKCTNLSLQHRKKSFERMQSTHPQTKTQLSPNSKRCWWIYNSRHLFVISVLIVNS